MVSQRMGITPEGTSSSNPIGTDRVNRNYAVYVNERGQRYAAPVGKPRNPRDQILASNLTLQQATEQSQAKSILRDLSGRAFQNAATQASTQAPTGNLGGWEGAAEALAARTTPGGTPADSGNNLAQAVENQVSMNQSNAQNLDLVNGTGGGLPVGGAGFDDTWLAGRNQGAVQTVMNGQQVADPRQALNWLLESQGLETHANRGFLEQAMSNYSPLYSIMTAGDRGLNPEHALLGAGNFASSMMGMTGNSMNRLNTEAIYDKIWSDAFRNFNSEQVDQTSGGPQAAYQRIVDSISALAPYMGQQNADYLLTRINMAYEDFLNRQTKGDGMSGTSQQDFLNYIMQFNPQDWY